MRLSERLKKAVAWLTSVVNVWASLLALGLAPTLATVFAVAIGILTGAFGQALLAALALSLVVNVALLAIAIRARLYSNALVADMELIGNVMRQRSQPSALWLPDSEGQMPVSNADFERYYDEAIALARSIAPDAKIGIGWIALSNPNISFNGFTAAGQKRFRIWCEPGNGCHFVQLERSATSVYPIDEPQWRTDSSWSRLVTKAMAVEAPFDGSVLLWPRRDPSVEGARVGAWRAEFRRANGDLVDQPTTYVLVDDELQRRR